jgi:hypothetical protein
MLPDEEPGWITMKEAKTLFSQEGEAYAFGEMDEAGKADLAAFASGNVQGPRVFHRAVSIGRNKTIESTSARQISAAPSAHNRPRVTLLRSLSM